MNGRNLASLALLAGLMVAPNVVRADSTFSLSLTTGSDNKLDLGLFSGGSILNFSFSGHGDLIDPNIQVNADGSLFSPASSNLAFANEGAAYSTLAGGDGINHFVGGGLNFDSTGSGFGFAGKMTTDTTDPLAIRHGAVVGTFSATPGRDDWFLIGLGSVVVIPDGGAHLYLAVNESINSDNNGAYLGTLTVIPEPSSIVMLGIGISGVLLRISGRKASLSRLTSA
ncbi:PEP-CTERM sorting domain-containing protein [Isosphaeraceae bacterium EP7]